MRLNLGCSDSHIAGLTNVDRCAPADQIADLRLTWPWEDSSVDFIRAHDIIEHLPDKIHTMNEIHRVLKPGGTVEIVVPTTDGRGADQDPTHCSYWNRNSFFYHEAGNPHLERFKDAYGMRGGFRVMSEKQETLADNVVKLAIVLQAVKTSGEPSTAPVSASEGDTIPALTSPAGHRERKFAFSILHTSARPNEWRKVYDAWLSAAANPEATEYILVVDCRWGFPLPPEEGSTFNPATSAAWPFCMRPQDKVIWNTGRRCYVDGVNLAAAASSGDVLIVNADDQYPCDKWDEEILAEMISYADPNTEYVIEVSTNTPMEHERGILVMPILSRERYERFGWVFYPGYESVYADNDFCAMARRDGVVIDARHLVFPHKHWINGQREKDEPDQAQNRPEAYREGERLFNARRAINFSGVPSTTQAPSAPLDDKRPLIAFATPGNSFGGAWLDAWTNLWTYMASNVKYNITHLRTYTSSAPIVRTIMARAILTTDYGVPVDSVMWIDDDNTITPEQFEMLMQDLREHPEYDAVVGWTWCGHDDDPEVGYATMSCGALINTEPTEDGQDVKFTKIRQLTHKDMYESATDLIEIGYSGFPAVLMRADLLRKAGPKLFTPFVDERCEHGVSGEDVAFFARCAIRTGARYAVDRRVKVPHYKRRAIEPVPTAEQVQEAQRLTAQLAATY